MPRWVSMATWRRGGGGVAGGPCAASRSCRASVACCVPRVAWRSTSADAGTKTRRHTGDERAASSGERMAPPRPRVAATRTMFCPTPWTLWRTRCQPAIAPSQQHHRRSVPPPLSPSCIASGLPNSPTPSQLLLLLLRGPFERISCRCWACASEIGFKLGVAGVGSRWLQKKQPAATAARETSAGGVRERSVGNVEGGRGQEGAREGGAGGVVRRAVRCVWSWVFGVWELVQGPALLRWRDRVGAQPGSKATPTARNVLAVRR